MHIYDRHAPTAATCAAKRNTNFPLACVQIGIVGLPNVGKSTTFNLLTKLAIPAENFPFCTIEPNHVRPIRDSMSEPPPSGASCFRFRPRCAMLRSACVPQECAICRRV